MEKTLKKMPVQVLKNRGWVERDGDTVRLTVKPNDLKERHAHWGVRAPSARVH